MAQCPVCNTEYVEGQAQNCSTCAWNLTQLMFLGTIPEELLEKERAKLTWAKELWVRSHSQIEQINQYQSQLELGERERSQFHSELNQLSQGQSQLQSQLSQALSQLEQLSKQPSQDLSTVLSQLAKQLAGIKAQLQQVEQERSQLRSDLSQIKTHLEQLSQQQPRQNPEEEQPQIQRIKAPSIWSVSS